MPFIGPAPTGPALAIVLLFHHTERLSTSILFTRDRNRFSSKEHNSHVFCHIITI
jgi:hypothetical protein